MTIRDTGPDHEAMNILADARYTCVTAMIEAAQRTPLRGGQADVETFCKALNAWRTCESAESRIFREMVGPR